jgi:hypothetical protein
MRNNKSNSRKRRKSQIAHLKVETTPKALDMMIVENVKKEAQEFLRFDKQTKWELNEPRSA